MSSPFDPSGTAATAGSAGTALLSVRHLSIDLPAPGGRRTVVQPLSFTLGRGRTLALVGESGSGKSMTALALMGLLPEAARAHGEMLWHGDGAARDWLAMDEAAWCRVRGARVAMVFQEPMTALNPLHTVGRQVAEPLRVHRGLDARAARVEALRLLDRVHLAEAARRLGAYPHQLSGGQRQRVMIAMALAAGPDLLIADEPTTALDVTTQARILDLLEELVAERGMALLLVSHDLGVVAHRTESVLVLQSGCVMEAGPTAEVFATPAHPYTRALMAARPRLGAAAGTRLAALPPARPGVGTGGCIFASRCAHGQGDCERSVPTLRPPPGRQGGAQRAACHRLEALCAQA